MEIKTNALSEILPVDECAREIITWIVNEVNLKLGPRDGTVIPPIDVYRTFKIPRPKISFAPLSVFIADRCVETIDRVISSTWNLDFNRWKYHATFMDSSHDPCAFNARFDVIFSIPTPLIPIPQAAVSIYVTFEYLKISNEDVPPMIYYYLESERRKYNFKKDILHQDRLCAILTAKIAFFKRLNF